MAQTFPVGGPRQAVYDALLRHGFVESTFSDKIWRRADGVMAHVYGVGSKLRLSGAIEDDGPLGEVLARLPASAAASSKDQPHA